jgi:hypothetical protein
LPNRATDRPESPSLRSRKGSELRLLGPALVDLMRAVLARGCRFRFCARGWSMSPFIRDGDVVTVAPSRPRFAEPRTTDDSPAPPEAEPGGETCGIGQIVAYVSPGSQRLVVHRIVGRRGSSFLVQGDSMRGTLADVVSPGDIAGRVVRIERGRKRVWLGLGPERYVVAVLSRAGLLLPLLKRTSMLTRFLRRRPREES